VRAKEVYDGAIPSGNSVMFWNMARLGRLTGQPPYEDRADELVKAFSSQIRTGPQSFTQFLVGFDFFTGPTHEVVISGDPQAPDTQAMLRALSTGFRPRLVVLNRPPGETPILSLAPFTREQIAKDGKATAYVCQNFACQAPVQSVDDMLKTLDSKREE
jgi:hypothetical protein